MKHNIAKEKEVSKAELDLQLLQNERLEISIKAKEKTAKNDREAIKQFKVQKFKC